MKISAINYQPQAISNRVIKQSEQAPTTVQTQPQASGSMYARSYANIAFSSSKIKLLSQRLPNRAGKLGIKMFIDPITKEVVKLFEYKPNGQFAKKTFYSQSESKYIIFFNDSNKVKTIQQDHLVVRPVSFSQKSNDIIRVDGRENPKTEPSIIKSTTVEFSEKDNSKVVTIERFDNPNNIFEISSQEILTYDKDGKLVQRTLI